MANGTGSSEICFREKRWEGGLALYRPHWYIRTLITVNASVAAKPKREKRENEPANRACVVQLNRLPLAIPSGGSSAKYRVEARHV